VNETAADGATPLIIAIASGREETALLLIERGADPRDDRLGYGALHVAVPKNALRVAKALLARGADPNARLTRAPGVIFGRSDGAGTDVRPASPPDAGAGDARGGAAGGRPPDLLAGGAARERSHDEGARRGGR
jgi:ankyrin repeat protein